MGSELWIDKLPWEEIELWGRACQVDKYLIAAVIKKESNNNPFAVRFEPRWKWFVSTSHFARLIGASQDTETFMQKSSWGPMQVMGTVARELGFKDWPTKLCSYNIGIEYGVKKLADLQKKHENFDNLVASYNAGSPLKNKEGKFVNQSYVDDIKILHTRIKEHRERKRHDSNSNI